MFRSLVTRCYRLGYDLKTSACPQVPIKSCGIIVEANLVKFVQFWEEDIEILMDSLNILNKSDEIPWGSGLFLWTTRAIFPSRLAREKLRYIQSRSSKTISRTIQPSVQKVHKVPIVANKLKLLSQSWFLP
jgi:hypothetical protein